jgi:hypothetical protein
MEAFLRYGVGACFSCGLMTGELTPVAELVSWLKCAVQ